MQDSYCPVRTESLGTCLDPLLTWCYCWHCLDTQLAWSWASFDFEGCMCPSVSSIPSVLCEADGVGGVKWSSSTLGSKQGARDLWHRLKWASQHRLLRSRAKLWHLLQKTILLRIRVWLLWLCLYTIVILHYRTASDCCGLSCPSWPGWCLIHPNTRLDACSINHGHI